MDKGIYYLFGKDAEPARTLPPSIPVLHGLSSTRLAAVGEYRKEFVHVANSIEIVSIYNIPIEKTINILKSDGNELEKRLINEFVRSADVALQEFKYDRDMPVSLSFRGTDGMEIPEDAIRNRVSLLDQAHLVSVYGGQPVPSLAFDSSGTKKIQALSSYIIEVLLKGNVLIIDELDSGLHFRLTRAIVALFNNVKNLRGQLVFTTHDITLLDTKRLMRKEQICFLEKKEGSIALTSLSNYKACDGTRETTDLIKHYNRGDFCSVPNPSFIKTILDILDEGKKDGKS